MAIVRGPVHHIALLVRDLAAAEAFYAGVLGLAVERRWPETDGSGTRSIWLSLGADSRLMLEKAAADDPRRGPAGGGWHLLSFAIAVEERAAIEAALAAANFPVESRTSFTLYVRDPEGNRVGLSHWPNGAETAETIAKKAE